ncbi:AAA family ATPase [Oleiphilus messinensis]|uniref:Replication-associated recombination protein A n=2 Tax=Oleiphilus messinensis TaxID=141451 RepID=A0A1Y0ICV5_9GAMM|nr:AAA family ATPase [Oleiphilus messinensis]
MSFVSDLFSCQGDRFEPLAARVRPKKVEDFFGQSHLLAPGEPLHDALCQGVLHSMILWGPPGVGKTSFANLLAQSGNACFISLSAVMSGVKEIKEAVGQAKMNQTSRQQQTVLFVDEVHRFNKSQQDAFLPYIENGTIVFVGATTENPSFSLNNALLSRARVYTLNKLTDDELIALLEKTITAQFGFNATGLAVLDEAVLALAKLADGDARRALNLLEILIQQAQASGSSKIGMAQVRELGLYNARSFDKGGDIFYEQISALHKSVRGSDPDAALYWYCRMLDGGCDPLYVARRVVRMASEDIGNADPKALTIALDAWQTMERLGSPEGELAIAQAVTYLAVAPKSNAVYTAFNQCRKAIADAPAFDVPAHLRNAPTQLLKSLGYGEEYRYAHDEPMAFAAGESYFPEQLDGARFYYPTDRGLEQKIGQKLEYLRELNCHADKKRYGSGTQEPES